MKTSAALLATTAALLTLATPAVAQDRSFNVPAQPAARSIPEFARQAGLQIIAPADELAGITTPAITGRADARAALRQLIENTGLVIASDRDGVIVLKRAAGDGAGASAAGVFVDPEIIVTGSRILRGIESSPNPVAVVSADALVGRTGGISIGDQLSLLPQFRTTQTQAASTALGTQPPGQVGLNLLDLRGLGVTRTLVLQNGRRLVSSTQALSQPDTNSIPVDLLERVDVLTGGASAIYGADAIAGVVNFVLKQDYEGTAIRLQGGISDRNDAEAFSVGVVTGTNFGGGRGNVAASFEYARRAGLRYTDRSFSSGQSDFIGNPLAGQAGQPATIPINDIRFLSYSEGGTLPYGPPFYRFQPDGRLLPANTGTATYLNLGISDGGDGFSPIATGSLLPKSERIAGTILGHYDLSDTLTLFGQLDALQQEATAFGSPQVEQFVLQKTNPYLSAQALGVLNSYGPTAAGTDLVVVRAMTDLGVFGEETTRSTVRGVAGLRGTLSDHLRFEASYSYGRTDITSRFLNNVLRNRIQLAANAVVDTAGVLGTRGAIVCASRLAAPTSTNADISQCVPMNIFGAGAVSAAARNYIGITTVADGRIEQHLAGGFLSGDTGGFLNLPGGPVSFVTGVEYRHESTRYTPDPLDTTGNTAGSSSATAGSLSVFEGYGEVKAPLLTDLPLIHRLELSGAVRVSNYNLDKAGTTTSWGGGALWQPTRGLSLRASYQRAVRAPNIAELYQPTIGGRTQITDPCDRRFIAQGNQFRAANCAALGIPATFQSPTIPITIDTVTRGNPDLDVERGRTYSFGVQIAPVAIPSFSLSVDYYNIRLKGAIAQANSTIINPFRVPSQCVDSATIANPFCALVTRDANFNITRVAQFPINLTRLEARGVDVDTRYAFDVGSSRIDLRGLLTYVIARDDFRLPSQPNFRTQIVETPSNPRWQATIATNLTLGHLQLSHNLRWFSSVFYKNDDVAFFQSVNGLPPTNPNRRAAPFAQTGDAWFHNLRAAYSLGEGRDIYVGVDNVGDRKPPFSLYGAGAVGAQFDSIGRSFYAGMRIAL
jgi:outer membrane receptor protein involved in Fe transport